MFPVASRVWRNASKHSPANAAAATPSTGHTVRDDSIRDKLFCCSILVANNGLAAVKFIRSVRMWAVRAFGDDRAVTLVAMATPEDIRINAEHVQLADQFVEVPGGTNNNNYANVRLILQTAERAEVDAVWPGW